MSTGAVVRQFERLLDGATVAGLGESQLLERFLVRKDEAAFEALVRRHGPMVRGVCRRVLRDEHEADDAFQATFLLLARKAGAIRGRDLVGPWLCRVAYRVSVRAGQQAARRRLRERPDAESTAGALAPAVDPAESETARVLLDELNRLPEKYRVPLTLCYLEGLSHEEAAARLRWPVGTVKGRLSRARVGLRDRLTRRGLAISTGLVASTLANEVRASVPSAVLNTTVRAAASVAAGKLAAGLLPASAVILARGVATSMLLHKLKWIGLSAVLAFGLLGAGLGAINGGVGGPGGDEPRPAILASRVSPIAGRWEVVLVKGWIDGRAVARSPDVSIGDDGRASPMTIVADERTIGLPRHREFLAHEGPRDVVSREQFWYALEAGSGRPDADSIELSLDDTRIYPGIYRLEGDTLSISYRDDGGPRPTTFGAEEPGLALVILKRADEPEAAPDVPTLAGLWEIQLIKGWIGQEQRLEPKGLTIRADDRTIDLPGLEQVRVEGGPRTVVLPQPVEYRLEPEPGRTDRGTITFDSDVLQIGKGRFELEGSQLRIGYRTGQGDGLPALGIGDPLEPGQTLVILERVDIPPGAEGSRADQGEANAADDDDVPADSPLRGRWEIHHAVARMDGLLRELEEDSPEGTVLIGNTQIGALPLPWKGIDGLKLDRTRRPYRLEPDPGRPGEGTIDITYGDGPNEALRGRYRLEGDSLQFVYDLFMGPRPEAFRADREGVCLVGLTRQKEPSAEIKPLASQADPLAGAWALRTRIVSGEQHESPSDEPVLVFREGRVRRGDEPEGAYRLDRAAIPWALDIDTPEPGETVRGIARREGDTLLLCLSPPGRPRPTEFASPQGSDAVLASYLKATEEPPTLAGSWRVGQFETWRGEGKVVVRPPGLRVAADDRSIELPSLAPGEGGEVPSDQFHLWQIGYELAPTSATSGRLDLTSARGGPFDQLEAERSEGLYRLDGPTLRICYRADGGPRPLAMGAEEPGLTLIVLHREDDPPPPQTFTGPEPTAEARPDSEPAAPGLKGRWKIDRAAGNIDGLLIPLPEDERKDKEVLITDQRVGPLPFLGTSEMPSVEFGGLTRQTWPYTARPDPERAGEGTIDIVQPTTLPVVDPSAPEEPGLLRGRYRLDGDRLVIVWDARGGPRPEAAQADRDGLGLLALSRQYEVSPAGHTAFDLPAGEMEYRRPIAVPEAAAPISDEQRKALIDQRVEAESSLERLEIDIEAIKETLKEVSRRQLELELGEPDPARRERLQERTQSLSSELDRLLRFVQIRREMIANLDAKLQAPQAGLRKVRPGDVLVIEALEALPGRPISGERQVKPDGHIHLGFYGEIAVAGLDRREIKAKVINHLRKYLIDEVLGLVGFDKDGQRIDIDPVDSDRIFVDEVDLVVAVPRGPSDEPEGGSPRRPRRER